MKKKQKQNGVIKWVIVFVVLNILILQASSMADSAECSLTEHIHTSACYGAETGSEPVLVCQAESVQGIVSHRHDSFCYRDDVLICPMEETVHTHDDACCDEAGVIICGAAVHQHSESCFAVPESDERTSVLICGQTAHRHTDTCVPVQSPKVQEAQAEPMDAAADGQDDNDAPAFQPIIGDAPAAIAVPDDAFVLTDDYISSIEIHYKSDNTWFDVTEETNHDLAADQSYRITVDYKNIDINVLEAAGSCLVYGPLPDWFRPKRTGWIADGAEVAATISVDDDGMVLIQFEEKWIAKQQQLGNTILQGHFDVSGEIAWDRIVPDEKGEVTFPGFALGLDFEDDLASKYGNVQIQKSEPETVKGENGKYYLMYQLQLTSLEETASLPDVRVTDIFANAAYVNGYVGITDGLNEPAALFPQAFLNDEPTASPNLVPIGTNSMDWIIGELQAGDTHTLIYYAEVNEAYAAAVSRNPIRNSAEVYSGSYLKGSDGTTFTSKCGASMKKTLSKEYIDAETGNGTLSYTITISANSNNTFDLQNLTLMDYFPAALKGFVHGDDGGTVLTVRAGNQEYTVDYTETSMSIPLEGISLAPGETLTITYTIYLENIFAASNGSIDLSNNASISSSGQTLATAAVNKTLEQRSWIRKMSGTPIPKPITVEMGTDRVYDSERQPAENPGSFTVEAGCLAYHVIVNEDGRWNLSSATMQDKFGNGYLQYTGYVKVQAFRRKATGQYLDDAALLSELEQAEADETVWLAADGNGEFAFQPNDLGFSNQKYTYLLTYYAKKVGMEEIGQAAVGNSFSVKGEIGNGNGSFWIPPIEVTVSNVVKGGIDYSISKLGWYYEPAPVYRKPENGDYADETFESDYLNGALYWVIRLEGSIPKGSGSGRGAGRGNQMQDFYLIDQPNSSQFRRDAVMGIYVAPKSLDVTQYDSYEAFLAENPSLKKLNGNPHNDKWFNDIPLKGTAEYEWYADDTELRGLAFPSGYKLRDDQVMYVVLRTVPNDNLAEGIASGNIYRPQNTLSVKEGESDEMVVNMAEIICCQNPSAMYKESKGAYVYDGEQQAWLNPSPIDSVPYVNNRPGTWPPAAQAMITESGVYTEWLLNVNWDGSMSGTADVSDFLPEGMELLYADIFWIGNATSGSRPYCEEIPELDLSQWVMQKQTFVYKAGNSAECITYYNPSTREIRWRISNLTSAENPPTRSPAYEVNLRLICRVTNQDVMLSRDSVQLENLAVTGDVKVTATVGINRHGSMDKSLLSGTDDEIQAFRIEINPLGETLCEGGALPALIDELGEDLRLLDNTLKVAYADGTPVTGYSYVVHEKDDRQTLMISGLPDGCTLVITYQTRIRSGKHSGEEIGITNSAYWNGYRPAEDNPQVNESGRYTLSGNVSAGTRPSILLTKADADQRDVRLEGAEFSLYTVDADGNLSEEPVQSGITAQDGTLQFAELDYDAVYCLVETKPPNGYQLNPEGHYFVVILNPNLVNDAACAIGSTVYPEALWAQIDFWYSTPDYAYTALNEKQKIYVDKAFADERGNPMNPLPTGKYRFGLYDTNRITEKTKPLEILTIEYRPQGEVRYYLDGVLTDIAPETKPYFTKYEATGVYYVYELDDSGYPIAEGSLATANRLTYEVSYEVNGEVSNTVMYGRNTVRITNLEHPVYLPAAGGNGARKYYIAASLLLLLTVSAFVYLKIRR